MVKQIIKTYPINQKYVIGTSITIIVYMIDECNYSCEYCINKFPRTHKLINIQNLYTFLTSLYDKTKKILLIELAGGEPLLHKNLILFLQMLVKSQIKYELSITTNFSYPFNIYKYIMNIINCDFVFSFHVISNNMQNHLNNFIKKLNMIDDQYKYKCTIRILYNDKYSQYCINALNEIFNQFNGKMCIEFCQLLSTQHYLVKYTKQQLNDYYKALNIIESINTQNEYAMYYNDGSIEYYDIYDVCVSQQQIMSNYHLWRCDAGKLNYYIHCDGNIYPCANYCDQYQKPLANINDGIYNFYTINKSTICLLHQCRCEFPLLKEKLI